MFTAQFHTPCNFVRISLFFLELFTVIICAKADGGSIKKLRLENQEAVAFCKVTTLHMPV
jgi:hypothetical protein